MTCSQETIEKGDKLTKELFSQLKMMAILLEPLDSDSHYTPWMHEFNPSKFIANLDDIESEITNFSCDYLDALIAFEEPAFDPDEAIAKTQNDEKYLPDEERTPEYFLNSLRRKDLSLIVDEAGHRISESQDEFFGSFVRDMLFNWNMQEEIQLIYEDGVEFHDYAVPGEMKKMNELPFPIPAIINGFLEALEQHRTKANDIFSQLKSLKGYPFGI